MACQICRVASRHDHEASDVIVTQAVIRDVFTRDVRDRVEVVNAIILANLSTKNHSNISKKMESSQSATKEKGENKALPIAK